MDFVRTHGRLWFLSFILSVAPQLFSAETESPNHTTETPDTPATAEGKAKPLDHDLSFGKSQNDSLAFKANLQYEQRQNIQAIKKLEQIRELQNSSNRWIEVATLLKEVLTSDTSQEIKNDVRQMALLGLADLAEGKHYFEQAQQYLAEFVERYPKHTMVPEILLRQAYLYQKMGAFDRVISKLYSVLKAAVQLELEAVNLTYYQRVTLTAQTEIAETHYAYAKYNDAAELYDRLLRTGSEELNAVVVKTKLIRSLSKAQKFEDVVRHSVEFLKLYSAPEQQAEIRYRLASSYKALGQKQESLRQLLLLLEAIEVSNDSKLKSWKMLAGNEIGNQLFLEGDSLNAVTVYKGLLGLEEALSWRLPIYYQIGLCAERLQQPDEAIKAYGEIIRLGQKTASKLEPSLQMVVDMAQFRSNILNWKKTLDKSAPLASERK